MPTGRDQNDRRSNQISPWFDWLKKRPTRTHLIWPNQIFAPKSTYSIQRRYKYSAKVLRKLHRRFWKHNTHTHGCGKNFTSGHENESIARGAIGNEKESAALKIWKSFHATPEHSSESTMFSFLGTICVSACEMSRRRLFLLFLMSNAHGRIFENNTTCWWKCWAGATPQRTGAL